MTELHERPDAEALWDRHADWWKAAFTDGADPEYDDEVFPLVAEHLRGARRVLDLGTGEGQVARALLEAPDAPDVVVGLDVSFGQLRHGLAQATANLPFVHGAGEHLPFADESFDAVLVCLVIEHADDVDEVLAEVARVLEVGGRFFLVINHPMFQGPGAGFVDDQVLGECYWRVGHYLNEQIAYENFDPGVTIPFAHRPISRYINPLAERDLLLTEMLEPPPLERFITDSVDPVLERSVPRLLAMCFERRPRDGSSASATARD
jgi:SAM-dependent methyltransferase